MSHLDSTGIRIFSLKNIGYVDNIWRPWGKEHPELRSLSFCRGIGKESEEERK
jgi:hypothetical protein